MSAVAQEGWEAHEEEALLEMAMLGKRIRRQQDRRVDVASAEGRDAARNLLRCMCRVGRMLGVQIAPRTYRHSIPSHTTTPFLDPEAFYSIRVLAVSCQQRRSVALNDQVFGLGRETLHLSLKLCRLFAEVGHLLQGIRKQGPAAIPKSAVVATLEAFDRAWAAFEQKLFVELQVTQMAAERPLAPLVRAIERLRDLRSIRQRFKLAANEEGIEDDLEYQEQRRLLVEAISRLNLAANPRSNQHVYAAQTLDEFKEMIQQCAAGQQDPQGCLQKPSLPLAMEPCLPLAVDAVGSFNDLCAYLHHLGSCLDSADPYLSNTEVLVEKLARWDSSWDRAIIHALDPAGRHALETLVASVREAQILSPELVEMCDECSAEMFLVLPRLLWLHFLVSPQDVATEVMDLLPHRFEQKQSNNGEVDWYPREALWGLRAEYRRTIDIIATAVANEALEALEPQAQTMAPSVGLEEAKMEMAARLLTRSAVLGIGGNLEKHATFLSPGPEGIAAREACETFVRGLESWSIELQRSSAREWNSFVSVIVRCLTADPLQGGERAEMLQV